MKGSIFAFLIFAAALTAMPLASRATAQGLASAPRVLTMSGMGEVKATPDMAEVNAGVTTTAPTAAAALAANTSQMMAVFGAIKKLGVAEKDIQTVNFSVSSEYAGGTNNVPPRLTGYRVNNEVRVRLDDVGKLGAILDALVTAGANQMNGINFGIKDRTLLLSDARAKALADARQGGDICQGSRREFGSDHGDQRKRL
jgi:hypothetical protein